MEFKCHWTMNQVLFTVRWEQVSKWVKEEGRRVRLPFIRNNTSGQKKCTFNPADLETITLGSCWRRACQAGCKTPCGANHFICAQWLFHSRVFDILQCGNTHLSVCSHTVVNVHYTLYITGNFIKLFLTVQFDVSTSWITKLQRSPFNNNNNICEETVWSRQC